jgi:enhancing lycopene biosynthesis protein 2
MSRTRVAVVLSGCGVFDGSEIHEAVLTLLALDRADCDVECLAPDVPQMHVIDHRSGAVTAETRNVLTESARIARGRVVDIAAADPTRYDAVVLPGGFGAAKNLCDFATRGENARIEPHTARFLAGALAAGRPIGAACIAPAVLATLLRVQGRSGEVTVGARGAEAVAIERMGVVHVACPVDATHFDAVNGIVTTPAYMSAASISEAARSIDALVDAVLERVRAQQHQAHGAAQRGDPREGQPRSGTPR